MIVKIDRSFEKDVRKINSESINRKIEKLILEIRIAESISKISNLKKSVVQKITTEYDLVNFG